MSDGVATRAGGNATTYSQIAAKTICCITPNKDRDSSSAEVSKEVLHLGRSIAGSADLEGGGAGAKGAGIDTPVAGIRDVPATTCKAWGC
ncbi:UNVERIFIED_CONTAM: hypothetical protein Sangu_0839400 [Sesamum angustifolium]|uniref:Uncharacterized protein n=1 Tax=Sesamum angustifolium TaxID=2727405 RepID=A0AAW2PWN1_9LAMI